MTRLLIAAVAAGIFLVSLLTWAFAVEIMGAL